MFFSFPSLLIPRIILILGFLGGYVLKHLASKRSLPKGTFATITHMTKTLIPKKGVNFYYETSLWSNFCNNHIFAQNTRQSYYEKYDLLCEKSLSQCLKWSQQQAFKKKYS